MNPKANLQNVFGATYVPGLGYVQGLPAAPGAGGQVGALGDDASVMMISGLGDTPAQPTPQASAQPTIGSSNITDALTQPVTLGSITLPLWVWLLVGGGALGAAAYLLLKKK